MSTPAAELKARYMSAVYAHLETGHLVLESMETGLNLPSITGKQNTSPAE